MSTTSTATPDWLLRAEVGLCPCVPVGRRRRTGFLDRTLAGVTDVLRQALFNDELATRPGLLQRLDPRVKVVTMLALLVSIGLLHTLPVLVAGYVLTLPLAAASGLPVWFFVRRVWLFVPVFTCVVVLPATLSVITPGDLLWTLWHWNGQPHGITEQGLRTAATVVTRVAASVSLAVLLTLTTPWFRLLGGLRSLGVPRTFVLVTGMAYRYLFLLLNTVTDMYTARRARSVGGRAQRRSGGRVVAAGIGTVFGKAHQLGEEVHQAMTARGYRGTPRTLDRTRVGAVDLGWIVGALAACVGMLVLDRALR